MRVRKLLNGDMSFGRGSADYWLNTPSGVGQCCVTRLRLILGEWFLDKTAGTDWGGRILGRRSAATYDGEIRRVILGTPGVASILACSSTLSARSLRVTAQILTRYSSQPVTLAEILAPAPVLAGVS